VAPVVDCLDLDQVGEIVTFDLEGLGYDGCDVSLWPVNRHYAAAVIGFAMPAGRVIAGPGVEDG